MLVYFLNCIFNKFIECHHLITHISVCNYVLSSDKSPLLLVVNKKSSKTLSALA